VGRKGWPSLSRGRGLIWGGGTIQGTGFPACKGIRPISGRTLEFLSPFPEFCCSFQTIFRSCENGSGLDHLTFCAKKSYAGGPSTPGGGEGPAFFFWPSFPSMDLQNSHGIKKRRQPLPCRLPFWPRDCVPLPKKSPDRRTCPGGSGSTTAVGGRGTHQRWGD